MPENKGHLPFFGLRIEFPFRRPDDFVCRFRDATKQRKNAKRDYPHALQELWKSVESRGRSDPELSQCADRRTTTEEAFAVGKFQTMGNGRFS
jgi:hypothetical protein